MRNRLRFLLHLAMLALTWHWLHAAEPDLRVGVQSAFVVDPHVLFLGPIMAGARHLYVSFVGNNADAP
jgi:peptide/nickel transport system substrate-binding protein